MTMEQKIEQLITGIDLQCIENGIMNTDLDLRLLELEAIK